MKKAALFLIFIFAIGAGAVFLILHRLGPTSSARLVPASTIALLDLPDLAVTSQRWESSAFAKMAAEPEIKMFLERPLDRFHQITASSTTDETLEKLLLKIKPGRFFAGIEALEAEDAWVMGCQFFGSNEDAERGFARLQEFFNTHFGTGEKVLLEPKENQGEIITQVSHGNLIVYSARHGNWFFVSNSLEAVRKSLDFLAGRSSVKESLEVTKLYQQNRSELLPEADFLFYVRPDLAMEIFPYLKAMMKNDETLINARSVGLSLCLTDEGMKERLFFGGKFPVGASLAHDGFRFTQPTTLGYVERTNEWNKVFGVLQGNKDLPAAFVQMLSPTGIDLSSLAACLKPETVLSINWPQSHAFPTGLIAIPVTDPVKINGWLDQAATRLDMTLQKNGDLQFISTPQLADGLKPTIAAAHGDFFIGTDPVVIQQAAQQAAKKTSRTTMEATPGVAKVDDLYHAANEIFGYFSTKDFFERGYGLARPGLLLGGSFIPGISTTLDLSKLPSVDSVARHLAPVVYAQSHVASGILVQSRGPLTATPLFSLGSVLYPLMQKKKTPNVTSPSIEATENALPPETASADATN